MFLKQCCLKYLLFLFSIISDNMGLSVGMSSSLIKWVQLSLKKDPVSIILPDRSVDDEKDVQLLNNGPKVFSLDLG